MSFDLFDNFPPKAARMHELCGAGADGFVLAVARHLAGPVIWVCQSWARDRLNPLGLCDYFDPSLITMPIVSNQVDGLAVAEEALRDAAVSLVVVELTQALDLTAGRRLQLAAKAGQTTGLALIQDGMGSNAAETRWRCQPVFSTNDSTSYRWDIIKNKSGTLGFWHVRWDRAAGRIRVVSPPGN